MLSFEALREANKLRQKEWDPENKITLLFRSNELAGEVGEACNIVKKIERQIMGLKGSRVTINDLADELADIVICADLAAMKAGVNLVNAIIRKFNQTSEKHGLSIRIGGNE